MPDPAAGSDPEEQLPAADPGPVLVWRAVGQSVAKPRNDRFENAGKVVWRQNEDRFRLAETAHGLLAAVADGAGGSGLYCGAWAEALVANLPDRPLRDAEALNDWTEGFWADFRVAGKARAAGDSTRHSKFVREGSFSTLAACWLRREEDGSVLLDWLGYGDSPFYIFQRSQGEAAFTHGHPATLAEFERDPHLLNWKNMAESRRLRTGSAVLAAGTVLVLATDGIGQFLLLRSLMDPDAHGQGSDLPRELRRLTARGTGRLADLARRHLADPGNGLARELDTLWNALLTHDSFAAMVRSNHERGLLANDDSTLVMIEIESAPIDESETPPLASSEEP